MYISVVKEKKEIGLDFEIDKLINSIENVVSGDSFATEVFLLNITKKQLVLFILAVEL